MSLLDNAIKNKKQDLDIIICNNSLKVRAAKYFHNRLICFDIFSKILAVVIEVEIFINFPFQNVVGIDIFDHLCYLKI